MVATVDVVIVTALREELDLLLEVTTGVVEPWRDGPEGDVPYHIATLEGQRGPIHVAAARPTRMGGVAVAAVATRLVEVLMPGCLAMCGVCAGHPEDTDLGDVVIADRVFHHDHGKLKAGGLEGDHWVHLLSDAWLRAAQDQAGPGKGLHGYVAGDDEAGQWWFIEQLLNGRDPLRSSALRRYMPDARRAAILETLRSKLGYVSFADGTFHLTDAGRSAGQERRAFHGTLITQQPYHIHVGPMGSGNAVVADGTIWDRLATNQGMRKTLAVEMEAASVGQLAHERSLPFVVVKGVMDHADESKSDRFKGFVARVSAEVLCDFLRRVVTPLAARPEHGQGSARERQGTAQAPSIDNRGAHLGQQFVIQGNASSGAVTIVMPGATRQPSQPAPASAKPSAPATPDDGANRSVAGATPRLVMPRPSVYDVLLRRQLIHALQSEPVGKWILQTKLATDGSPLIRSPLLSLDEPICRLAVEMGVFREPKTCAEFLCPLPNEMSGSARELERRRMLILAHETASEPAKVLLRLVDELIERFRMKMQWAKIIQGRHDASTLTKDDDVARVTMARIYFKAQILWERSRMNIFVKSDIEQEMWNSIVDTPQATGAGYAREGYKEAPAGNHLHHANNLIGDVLGQHFALERRWKVDDTFMFLEGGVGGANTTHQVLARVFHHVGCQSNRPHPYSRVEYKGFEVNEYFQEPAEAILQGHYMPSVGTAQKGISDPRSAFFDELHRTTTFRTVDGDTYVQRCDMYDGFRELSKKRTPLDEQAVQADAVVFSYSFHHVPNGRALLHYLFGAGRGPTTLGPPDDAGDSTRLQGRSDLATQILRAFRHRIQCDLRQTSSANSPRGVSFDVDAIAASLHGLMPDWARKSQRHLSDIESRVGKALEAEDSGGVEAFFMHSPDWLTPMLADHQEELLRFVYDVLRPNGMLAIADPDGFSEFNRRNLLKNAEMGVAHFLNLQQIAELLRRIGFEVRESYIQKELRRPGKNGGLAVVAEKTNRPRDELGLRKDEIADDNLGYVIFAIRPDRVQNSPLSVARS